MVALGECVNEIPPPESHQLQLLNNVWKLISQNQDIVDYLKSIKPWIQFTASFFTVGGGILIF